jgi:hypothetical protein
MTGQVRVAAVIRRLDVGAGGLALSGAMAMDFRARKFDAVHALRNCRCH